MRFLVRVAVASVVSALVASCEHAPAVEAAADADCEVVETTSLRAGDPDFDALVATVSGERYLGMQWWTHQHDELEPGRTELRIAVTVESDSGRAVERTRNGGGCPDLAEVDVRVRLETADGSFDDAFAGVATRVGSQSSYRGSLPVDEFDGSYAISDEVLEQYRDPRFDLLIRFDESWSGQLSLGGSEDDDPSSGQVAATVAEFQGDPMEPAPTERCLPFHQVDYRSECEPVTECESGTVSAADATSRCPSNECIAASDCDQVTGCSDCGEDEVCWADVHSGAGILLSETAPDFDRVTFRCKPKHEFCPEADCNCHGLECRNGACGVGSLGSPYDAVGLEALAEGAVVCQRFDG